VGGGIAGCGLFRDLSLRGVSTVLVEKGDFASGTTSRSTRIVHGGIRYLENYEFGLVREGLRERSILLKTVPHLVKPLRFVLPVYRGMSPGRIKVKAGMVLYDLLSSGKSLPSHRFVSKEEAKRIIPSLSTEGLVGAYLYYDAHVPFVERLCLENILSGEAEGGRAHNYCEVVALLREDARVSGAVVRSTETADERKVWSKCVVNCTGPWADSFLGTSLPRHSALLSTTKGIHLFCPSLSGEAVVFYSSDGRLLFAIPWEGYSLVGTTDTAYDGDPDAVHTETEDVKYVLEAIAGRFPSTHPQPFSTVAGLRPLVFSDSKHPSKIPRGYAIFDHSRDKHEALEGLVSVLGVKITEYRAAAAKTGNLICRKLGVRGKSTTRFVPLTKPEGVASPVTLPAALLEHLTSLYGPRVGLTMGEVAADGALLSPLCPHNPDVAVQVVVAVKFERARRLADFMLRRSLIGYTPCKGLDAVDRVAELMGRGLGWSPEKVVLERSQYTNFILRRDEAISGISPEDPGGRAPPPPTQGSA
jgi:glycerol-3-phosphate dehydrogenase